MFDDKIEFKPSSVVITTLAAKAYLQSGKQSDFWELTKSVVSKLETNVEMINGNPCVMNPVDANENLSLKWNLEEEYYSAFKNWIEQLKFDFSVDAVGNVNEQFSMVSRSLRKIVNNNQLQTSLNSLPYHLKSRWKDNIWKDVYIQASVVQRGFTKKVLHSGQAVGKKAEIKFEVKAENESKSFTVPYGAF